MMRQQFRSACLLPKGGPMRGKVEVSQLLALSEKALLSSWDGSKAEHLNTSVGYYVDPSDGLLKYDILAQHRESAPPVR